MLGGISRRIIVEFLIAQVFWREDLGNSQRNSKAVFLEIAKRIQFFKNSQNFWKRSFKKSSGGIFERTTGRIIEEMF